MATYLFVIPLQNDKYKIIRHLHQQDDIICLRHPKLLQIAIA